MKRNRRTILSALLLGFVTGCSLPVKNQTALLSVESELDRLLVNKPVKEAALKAIEPKVINPPATTIRFDGKETVLGTADITPLTTNVLSNDLSALLAQEKFYTATKTILANPRVAEQLLWERYLTEGEDPMAGFVADVLSRDLQASVAWTGFRATLQANPTDGAIYHRLRTTFTETLKSENPSEETAQQLKVVAQRLNHPLVMMDALRLLALRELVNDRHAWAESLFLQAAKIAEQHQDRSREAELWLMVVTTATRSDRPSGALNAWEKAAQTYVDFQISSGLPMSVGFWLRAEDQRPVNAKWPAETSQALAPYCGFVGIPFSKLSEPELVLWCAVATAQYEQSEHQAALLNFKKAETFASGDDVTWLRIAQSKCLAGLGQSAAASALLSGPAANADPMIAIAATAAIGSAKLQAGTFQQGMQLLSKALNDPRVTNWPNRSRAEADLALALLILGETAPGLDALHTAQHTFETQGDKTSLLQALENELRLLVHEGRGAESASLQDRIHLIERS